MSFGGQGARREAGSEGYAEKYRAVVDEGYLKDEPVGQRWGKVEHQLASLRQRLVCAWGARHGRAFGRAMPPSRGGQRGCVRGIWMQSPIGAIALGNDGADSLKPSDRRVDERLSRISLTSASALSRSARSSLRRASRCLISSERAVTVARLGVVG